MCFRSAASSSSFPPVRSGRTMTLPAITCTRPARLPWLGIGLALIGAAIVLFTFTASGYVVTVVGFAAIYAIFVTGLNFFMGYTGQASFGQNAFAAIGGYGTAVLCERLNWDPVLAFVVSMALAGGAAAAIGYSTLKLRSHYLTMATFALGTISYEITVEWTSLTHGYMGYLGIPPMGFAGFELATDKQQLVVIALLLLLGVWISVRLVDSRFERAL